ncbi:MAG: YceI family protein [Myxococcales bacterium]|nr:YceI family protein [Myxococcales bacterium]
MSPAPTIRVFTFKAGFLARVAHNLRLTLERFKLEVTSKRIEGHFDLTSLRVEGAMAGGQLAPGALSADDRRTIERNMAEEILHLSRWPRAHFRGALAEGSATRLRVDGALELHGVTADISCHLELGERLRGKVELRPSRWGIPPYRAMAGALKLQDRVEIEIDLPGELEGLDHEAPGDSGFVVERK